MNDTRQKKKLFFLVGALMCVVVILWIFVFFPASSKRASKQTELTTGDVVDQINKAQSELEFVTEEANESRATLFDARVEEEKEKIDIPRLPESTDLINESGKKEGAN